MVSVGVGIVRNTEITSSPARFRGELQRYRHPDVPKLFLPSSFDNSRGCHRGSRRPTPTIHLPRLAVYYHAYYERVSSRHVREVLTGNCQQEGPNSLGQLQDMHRIGSGSKR